MTNKLIPIGKEDFKKLIETNCYYVDKTNIIKEILMNGADVTLFPRPRRFGKTLTISMLENYFDITKKEENKDLFKGLNIDKAPEEIKKHFGAYPVIKLGLKEVKASNFELQYEQLKIQIAMLYRKHDVVESLLNKEELEYFENILNRKASIADYQMSIRNLSEYLERYYNKKVVILIDEYDAPIEAGFINKFYDENMDLIKKFFGAALKTNDSLAFAVMTGILKISSESIFSDLNNPAIYSITDELYSEYIGFTEKETKELLENYDLELTEEVKEWYDGYKFGEIDIYNPWSILNYAQRKKFDTYWGNTGGISLLEHLVKNADKDLKEILKDIIDGKTYCGLLNSSISYKNLSSSNRNILNFLLLTGYLTYSRITHTRNGVEIEYKLPNVEIGIQLKQLILNWFENTNTSEELIKFQKALFRNDVKEMNYQLNSILLGSISFFDSKENFYHGFMVGIFVNLMDEYIVTSNRESGYGRYDMTIASKDLENVYIFEFKLASEEETIEESANEGLKQIKAKEYREEFKRKNYKNIYEYGASFNKKRALIIDKEQ